MQHVDQLGKDQARSFYDPFLAICCQAALHPNAIQTEILPRSPGAIHRIQRGNGGYFYEYLRYLEIMDIDMI